MIAHTAVRQMSGSDSGKGVWETEYKRCITVNRTL